MGIYDRQYYRDSEEGFSIESLTRGKSVVFMLVALNVGVFIADVVAGKAHPFSNGLASDFLTITGGDLFRPWFWFRFLTYGFAHGSPTHLFWNMFGLYMFGSTVESFMGSAKFLWFYITAVVLGSVCWMAGAYLFDRQDVAFFENAGLLGASGGVAAVIIFFCLKFPHQMISPLFLPFIKYPAWLMGILFVLGDLVGFFQSQPSRVAFIVHLAGAAYAYAFSQTGWSFGNLAPANVRFTGFAGLSKLFKSKPNLKVHRPSSSGGSGDRKHERLAEKADAILQKLHEQGETSLTARERKILEEYSQSIKQKNG